MDVPPSALLFFDQSQVAFFSDDGWACPNQQNMQIEFLNFFQSPTAESEPGLVWIYGEQSHLVFEK